VIPPRMLSSEIRGVDPSDHRSMRPQARAIAQRAARSRLTTIESRGGKCERIPPAAAITASPGSSGSFTCDRRLPVAADRMISGIKISLRGSRPAQVQVRTTASRCQRRKICLLTSRM